MSILLILLAATAIPACLGEDAVARSWLLFPGDGGPHLALLRGHVPQPASQERDNLAVNFYFYCRNNPNIPLPITLDSVNDVPFDPSRKTKVIIHGYASGANASWVQDIKNELLRQSDCQVVVMDWASLVQPPLYQRAVQRHLALAGEQLAMLLSSLVSTHGARYPDMHLVGISLGAHLAGYAGRALQRSQQREPPSLRMKLARITGLDPALPLFEMPSSARLHKDDASFVDVIHTCGDWLGIAEPLGHADFYPNGARPQPGCGADFSGCCSHARAVEYFIESIPEEGAQFRALRCDSQSDFENNLCCDNLSVAMGFHAPKTEGTYFLATAAEVPYALD